MALKGNLCWNGDFETGTFEGWSDQFKGLPSPNLAVMDGEGIDGSYGLWITPSQTNEYEGFCYDMVFPFEERELYFVEVQAKNMGASIRGQIEYLDAYKRVLGYDEFGVALTGGWERMCALVARRFGASYFRVGFVFFASGDYVAKLDNLSVIGLTHSRDWVWSDYHSFSISGETYDDWYCNVAIFVKHSYSWIIDVRNITGSSPSVVLVLKQLIPRDRNVSSVFDYDIKTSDTFTSTGQTAYAGSVSHHGYYKIRCQTSGSDTEVDVNTCLTLIPFI